MSGLGNPARIATPTPERPRFLSLPATIFPCLEQTVDGRPGDDDQVGGFPGLDLGDGLVGGVVVDRHLVPVARSNAGTISTMTECTPFDERTLISAACANAPGTAKTASTRLMSAYGFMSSSSFW